MASDTEASEALQQIIESARELGVEVNEAEALQWLAAMAVDAGDNDVVFDVQSGVYGHKVSMLDFSPADLARLRRIGEVVDVPDRPGVVETALALSGSAAQSKIQTYPGDCDYFERVNIKAPTRDEAVAILADVMREKVLASATGPTYRFVNCQMGSWPEDVEFRGHARKAGRTIEWTLEDVNAGRVVGTRPDGSELVITWDEASRLPGWNKMDWIVLDPARGKMSNASSVLDVTWEGPDGEIVPLDGMVDPYFQEVYLDAASLPTFAKVATSLSAEALDEYVDALEGEVRKYVTKDPNYGKAAKRMYNVFRLTGRYVEAAVIRELFDEPLTILYQVWTLIRTLQDAVQRDAHMEKEQLLEHTQELLMDAIRGLDDQHEGAMARKLMDLRDRIQAGDVGADFEAAANAVREELMTTLNAFFIERLNSVPTIREYLDQIKTDADADHS